MFLLYCRNRFLSSSDTMQNMYIEPLTFDIFIRKLGQPQNRPYPAIGAEYRNSSTTQNLHNKTFLPVYNTA